MLFSNVQEISHIIPSSKVAKIDNLISRLNSEEMNSLYPLIGMPLLQQLRTDYATLSQQEGGIWATTTTATPSSSSTPSSSDPSPSSSPVPSVAALPQPAELQLSILRTAQEILLYSFLANYAPILQSSFNMGGGFNLPSTGDYEALDAKANDRLDNNLWHASLRSKENLLTFLEMDARDQQIYTSLWKESDYFYLHEDLLFTTSSELHPKYINLGKTPHLNFQAYTSTLQDCQDGYIAGTIGYDLLQALIDRKYTPQSSSDEDESAADTAKLWRTLDRHIRTSLANFTMYEHDGAKHDHLRNRGQSQLSIATRFIHDHYATFAPHIPEGTPIYDPQLAAQSAQGGSTAATPSSASPSSSSSPSSPSSPSPSPRPVCGDTVATPPHRGTVFSLLH